MSFQPVIPLSGLAGWSFLKATQERQETAFSEAPTIVSDTEYFIENISKIETAEQLVTDHRLLKVALGAFGLSDDLQNTFFIRTVLEEGTLTTDSLANKLTDTNYKELSAAFGFGDYDTPRTKISDFGENIVSLYQQRQFEIAVGTQDESLRLALNTERELADIADKDISEDAKWYLVMGSTPLREVFETAFGLPSSFGQLDLDQQLGVFRSKTESVLGDGDISQFSDGKQVSKLVDRFLIMSQISGSSSSSSAQIALTLLQA